MKISVFLLAIVALSSTGAAHAASNPCAAAAHASPLTPSRGRLVVTRDIAAFVARHAEIACARLDALVRDGSPDDAALAAKARVIQGELETGVLAPVFALYPDLRDRDLTAADAPGAAVKLGKFDKPPIPRQMGFATAQHLRWVSSDASRRFSDLMKRVSGKPSAREVPKDEAGKKRAAAVMSAFEDASTEIGFVDAPALRNYPRLWKVTERELEARMPKNTRTAESDANFRKAAPPAGSVKLTAAAVAQMRAFEAAMKRDGHGCHVLGLSWVLMTRSRGPDDATWHETGPSVEVGAWGCGQIPPDAVQTIDGLRVLVSDDKDHHFAGKTVDYVDKRFVIK